MRIRGTELSLRRADMDPFGCALTGTAREYGRRVNLASRLEYHGEPGQILVSDSVADQLADDFLFSPSTIIDLKGKGPTSVQVLLGRKAAAVTTPEPAAETSATVS
jgi:class 3 adenylate cyclase